MLKKYKVIKMIKEGKNTLAKPGDILDVFVDCRLIGGQEVLMKDDEYICDVGSKLEQEYCEQM